jgi:hypothetical protein
MGTVFLRGDIVVNRALCVKHYPPVTVHRIPYEITVYLLL